MPQRSTEFQHLVAVIEKGLRVGDQNATVTESKELLDTNGEKTEVDVVIDLTHGVLTTATGIEVNERGRPATKAWVDEMWAKHERLPINQTVLVSKSGFAKTALRLAEQRNIPTFTLLDAKKLDWKSVVMALHKVTVVSFLMPVLQSVKVIFSPSSDDNVAELEDEMRKIALDKAMICRSGFENKPILEFVYSLLHDANVIKELYEIAFTDSGTIVDLGVRFGPTTESMIITQDGKEYPILGCDATARCRKEIKDISLEHGAYGGVAVAHGRGTTFDRPIQIAAIHASGQDPTFALSVKKPKKKKK